MTPSRAPQMASGCRMTRPPLHSDTPCPGSAGADCSLSDCNFNCMQYHRDWHAAASWLQPERSMLCIMRRVCPGTLACSNRSQQTPTGRGYPLGRWQESPIGFRVLVMTSETRVARRRQKRNLLLARAALRWESPRAAFRTSLGQRSVD